jgi:c-di-GMP-binding flagellar brake protein YcgR
MADNNRQVLSEAIARNCAAIFSLPSAGLLRHHKSRFLAETGQGVWLEVPASEIPLIQELIGTQKPAGISFKNGQTKVVFTTPIIEYNLEYRINAETKVPAALIAFPEQVKAIQRRSNYRVRVFAGCELSVRVWRIAPRGYLGDRPMSTQEVKVTPRDLSLGGMGMTIHGEDGKPPKISTEDRLRLELRYGEHNMLIEGSMRNPAGPQPQGAICTGIRFKEMAADIEGRQKLTQLTRIVGEMQREEVRRARLGIA